MSECECGKEHICIDSYGFSEYSEQEKKDIAARESEDVIIHHGFDHVSIVVIAGSSFVECCECEGWKPYMTFILNNRSKIKDFLIVVADKATRALEVEQTFNVLKKPAMKILDDPPF